jgi:hypothetical protein
LDVARDLAGDALNRGAFVIVAVLACAAAAAACSSDANVRANANANANANEGGHANANGSGNAEVLSVLPDLPGRFAPSEIRLVGDADPLAGSRLADVDTCETCHEDAAAAWRKSAHAFASFGNPVYRTSVERLRHDRGVRPSLFCAGCHDIALLVDGAMTEEISPKDLRAHAGVSCRVCHGIARASTTGNGSFTLDPSEIPIPKEHDAASLAAHKARVASPALRGNEICISCHRATLDDTTGNSQHHLVGQDDATPWMRSAYAGSQSARVDPSVLQQNCRECHMPKVDAQSDQGAKYGKIASHRFLGGHTYLAAMTGDQDAIARARAFLIGAATIRVGALISGYTTNYVRLLPIELHAGDDARLDVVVKNQRVGHRFPGGVADAQDTWIELTVRDAQGRAIAEAGAAHAEGLPDETAHGLFSYLANESAERLLLRETHEFAASVFNHTIGPRDAVVTSFNLHVPEGLADDAFPVTVDARLRHRSRDLGLARAACADSKSERGKAFGREGLKKVSRALDGCVAEPITLIDETHVTLGRAPSAPGYRWQDSYDYALGLSHVVQERLDEAARASEIAIISAPGEDERAMAEALLADILAHQGNLDGARIHLARARSRLGDHPALSRIEGEALVATWRLAEAVPLFERVSMHAPLDDSAFAELAITRGGALDPRGALSAAVMGLRVSPREESLLRVQALSLADLPGDPAVRARAMAEYLNRRSPDDAPAVRGKCSATIKGCANERLTVHAHPLHALNGPCDKSGPCAP